jgi:hypothetical protein
MYSRQSESDSIGGSDRREIREEKERGQNRHGEEHCLQSSRLEGCQVLVLGKWRGDAGMLYWL